MKIRFDQFFDKTRRFSGIATQAELATLLNVNRSAVTQAKNRDSVPEKWLLAIARKFALRPDWFENDCSSPAKTIFKPSEVNFATQAFFRKDVELVNIPKVSATLCAGGGSFEVEPGVIGYMPMPFSLVRSFGTPANLVFMDVRGKSMEPGIYDGDTVLIDQAAKEYHQNWVMAVGYEDSIYIKRLQKHADGGVSLLSDNPEHYPIHIYGDELQTLRIIGKLVWLCRKI